MSENSPSEITALRETVAAPYKQGASTRRSRPNAPFIRTSCAASRTVDVWQSKPLSRIKLLLSFTSRTFSDHG